MSEFQSRTVKGIDKVLQDPTLHPDRLRLHISEIAPGTSSHPPHTHQGVEAFYVLAGEGEVEIEGVKYPLKTNEAIVLNPGIQHGLTNTGTVPMRYLVVISKESE